MCDCSFLRTVTRESNSADASRSLAYAAALLHLIFLNIMSEVLLSQLDNFCLHHRKEYCTPVDAEQKS